jgi:hypothetical protein
LQNLRYWGKCCHCGCHCHYRYHCHCHCSQNWRSDSAMKLMIIGQTLSLIYFVLHWKWLLILVKELIHSAFNSSFIFIKHFKCFLEDILLLLHVPFIFVHENYWSFERHYWLKLNHLNRFHLWTSYLSPDRWTTTSNLGWNPECFHWPIEIKFSSHFLSVTAHIRSRMIGQETLSTWVVDQSHGRASSKDYMFNNEFNITGSSERWIWSEIQILVSMIPIFVKIMQNLSQIAIDYSHWFIDPVGFIDLWLSFSILIF